MRPSLRCPLLMLALLGAAPLLNAAGAPRALLDETLSQWEVFLGVPHKSVAIAGQPASTSENGRDGTPVGLSDDPLGIFRVVVEDGRPVLRISGQIYGGLTSRDEFENFHFSCQFKWGTQKWPPRLTDKRDSGVLYHCTGKHGAFWNVWMRSLECQVQEGDCGDFIPLAGSIADVPLFPVAEKQRPVFDLAAPLYSGVGYIGHGPSHEKPNGEWNTVEIYALGDIAVHVVNGTPNMVLFNTRQKSPDGKGEVPLTRGKLQIQSEAAEVFYRDIVIEPIAAFPEFLARLTQRPSVPSQPYVPVRTPAGVPAAK